jgi:DegV family protein with EDD domain
MTVAIITDSAAALPAEFTAARKISVVPMWLNVDGEAIREGTMPLAELVERADVKTSGPSPGEFEETIRARLSHDGGGDVLVCTIASTMSATYEAAVIGATASGGRVRVVDTGTAAGAQALVVLAAADAAQRGASLDEVAAVAEQAAKDVRLVATVPSLDHLVRSGRVPNLAGWAGRRLGVAPLFEFRDGRAHPLRPALGMQAALDRIVARCRREATSGATLYVAALHADAEDAARTLLERVVENQDVATAFVASFGSVMAVHTGLGLVGLAWRWGPRA